MTQNQLVCHVVSPANILKHTLYECNTTINTAHGLHGDTGMTTITPTNKVVDNISIESNNKLMHGYVHKVKVCNSTTIIIRLTKLSGLGKIQWLDAFNFVALLTALSNND